MGTDPDPALVVAALRMVDRRPSVDPLDGTVRTDELGSGLSAADECALEHALRIAEGLGGRCLAVTVGTPGSELVLRQALSVGAWRALRVAGTPASEEATARALAAGIGRTPSVVVCGDRSADRGTGATPAYLAALFGTRQALGLLRLELAGGGLRAERRLDGGRRERLELATPVVCSVEPTDVRLRRASLNGVLASRRAAIDTVRDPVAATEQDPRVRTVARRPYRPRTRAIAPPSGSDPNERVLELTGALTEHEPARLVHPGSAAEAADELLGYLRQHGYLTGTPGLTGQHRAEVQHGTGAQHGDGTQHSDGPRS